jgi:hypothetical protein
MFKSYAEKSKAKRGLSAYGDLAVLAADKLVHMADVDGVMKWGFLTEQAEAARDGRDFGTFEEKTAAAREGNPDDAAQQAATMEIGTDSAADSVVTGDEEGASSEEGSVATSAFNPFGGLGARSASSNDLPPLAAPAVRGRAPRETRYTIEKNRPEANGIKRPSEGGICRQIWDALDEKYSLDKTVPSLSSTKDALAHLDQTTVSVQYYRWRKHNGIAGRLDKKPSTEATPATDDAAAPGKSLGEKIAAQVGE